ncbi:MAG: xanthine dehydrogenase family protein molybdopterin-binding subunit [Thermoplasmata archaeon]|nr:xanthine dehydrogenase family protein molybdopterin-binding subunit [Thermoplasmata archaeon]
MSARSDATAKLTGATRYGTDLQAPGMLWGALVLSPVSRGRIRSIDLRPARALPGVVAVGPEETRALFSAAGDPERPVFPALDVAYRNQVLAAVAAPTLEIAREAAARVLLDIEPLPPAVDLDVMFPEWPTTAAKNSPHINAHVHAVTGDVDRAFRDADLVLAETYRTSGVSQVALEPHACLATVEGGEFRVQSSTQSPFGLRDDLASILGVPEPSVVVEGTWVGGGFGGKAASLIEPYALVLAAAAGRPVKLSLNYREEFLLGRSTLPSVVRIESAVKGGRLSGRRVRLLLDTGASLPGRDFATGYAIGFLLGPYRIPDVEMEGYAVRTNKPPFGPHRAPFAPQCVFVAESHMDAIARRLKVDPIDFRLAHALGEGDRTALGQPVGPFGLVRCLELARAQRDEWRKDAPAGRGIGIGAGFWSTGTGAGGEAVVWLTPTRLEIVQGEREIGSGSIIRGLSAVAERVLGLPPEAIEIVSRSTVDAPFDSGVFGSRTLGALGRAVEQACRSLAGTLGERLGEGPGEIRLRQREDGKLVAEREGQGRPVSELITAEELASGGLSASGRHFGTGGRIDETRVRDGSFYPYTDFTATVQLAEVTVDPETGTVHVDRYAAFQDVGQAIDPAMVRGQVEGGVAMGLGAALTEETLWSDDGRLLNPGLLDYRIPTLGEVPPISVTLVEGFPGAGPFGAKGAGEPPIIPAPAAVANAVTDATGAEVRELPLTAERVARALKLL